MNIVVPLPAIARPALWDDVLDMVGTARVAATNPRRQRDGVALGKLHWLASVPRCSIIGKRVAFSQAAIDATKAVLGFFCKPLDK
jgi:hypothetical protein